MKTLQEINKEILELEKERQLIIRVFEQKLVNFLIDEKVLPLTTAIKLKERMDKGESGDVLNAVISLVSNYLKD